MKPALWIRGSVAALSALTCAAAIAFAVPEARNARQSRLQPARLVLDAAYGQPDFAPARSLTAQVRQMAACDDLLASKLIKVAGRPALYNLAAACQKRAEDVLLRVPSLAAARLARARALQAMGLRPDALDELARARAAAPLEGWQAARRLRLLFDLGIPADGSALRSGQADALVVLQDARFRFLLTDLYLEFPHHRRWLAGVLQPGGAADLQQFLSLTRSRAEGGPA